MIDSLGGLTIDQSPGASSLTVNAAIDGTNVLVAGPAIGSPLANRFGINIFSAVGGVKLAVQMQSHLVLDFAPGFMLDTARSSAVLKYNSEAVWNIGLLKSDAELAQELANVPLKADWPSAESIPLFGLPLPPEIGTKQVTGETGQFNEQPVVGPTGTAMPQVVGKLIAVQPISALSSAPNDFPLAVSSSAATVATLPPLVSTLTYQGMVDSSFRSLQYNLSVFSNHAQLTPGKHIMQYVLANLVDNSVVVVSSVDLSQIALGQPSQLLGFTNGVKTMTASLPTGTLVPGVAYQAQLRLYSDESTGELAAVQINNEVMTIAQPSAVVQSAIGTLTGNTLQFGADSGGATNATLSITNAGTAALHIKGVSIAGSDFALAQPIPTPVTILNGGGVLPLTIQALSTTQAASGVLTIQTDDPANPAINITLVSIGGLQPAITWNPTDIAFGTPLGPAQLDATAPVPGMFVYTPGANVILSPGVGQVLSVTFMPSDLSHYKQVAATAYLNVAPTAAGTLVSSANPSSYGQPVTITMTLAPAGAGAPIPTGTVLFTDKYGSGTALWGTETYSHVNGQLVATVQLNSPLSPGANVITASYSGDSYYASSAEDITQLVNAVSPAAKIASSLNPSIYGQAVTVTMTVGPAFAGAPTPTGTVLFTNSFGAGTQIWGVETYSQVNGNLVASVRLTSPMAAGTNTIKAVYSGDGFYYSPVTLALNQVVSKQGTTTTVTTAANQIIAGQPVALTATVAGANPTVGTVLPTGSVTFMDGTVSLGSGTLTEFAGKAVATLNVASLPAGTNSITAVYSGDANYIGSVSPDPEVVVLPAKARVVAGLQSFAVTTNQPASSEAKRLHAIDAVLAVYV